MECEHNWAYKTSHIDCFRWEMGDINQWHPCYGASCPCDGHTKVTTYVCTKCGMEKSDSHDD